MNRLAVTKWVRIAVLVGALAVFVLCGAVWLATL